METFGGFDADIAAFKNVFKIMAAQAVFSTPVNGADVECQCR
jgi:hypothetical protein